MADTFGDDGAFLWKYVMAPDKLHYYVSQGNKDTSEESSKLLRLETVKVKNLINTNKNKSSTHIKTSKMVSEVNQLTAFPVS